MFKKILVPTDGSEHSNRSVEHALWFADKTEAEIIALNVVETSKLPEIRSDDLKNQLHEMMESEGKSALESVYNKLQNDENNFKTTFLIKEGSPSDIILKTIEDESIDIVIMGTSGKHGLDRLLLGSVAEKVLRNAQCTVTVVK
jgi:nucleotide-binding universal stress UspA family protein